MRKLDAEIIIDYKEDEINLKLNQLHIKEDNVCLVLKKIYKRDYDNSNIESKDILHFGKKIVSNLNYREIISNTLSAYFELLDFDYINIKLEKFDNNFNYFESTKHNLDIRHSVFENSFNENKLISHSLYRSSSHGKNLIKEKYIKCHYKNGKSIIVMSILDKERKIGEVALVRDGSYLFYKRELDLVKSITDYLNIAIINSLVTNSVKMEFEKAQIKEQGYQMLLEKQNIEHKNLIRLSYVDKLTQINNLRYYEESLIKYDNKKYLPLAVIVADINSLKVVNDAFGHFCGDRLIKKTANVLKICCSEVGAVSRIGGDEFGIIIPNANLQNVLIMINDIKRKLELVTGLPVEPSISMGVALKFNEAENIKDIITHAENIMYEKKLIESLKTKSHIMHSLLNKMKLYSIKNKKSEERIKLLSNRMISAMKFDSINIKKLFLLFEMHNIGEYGISREILDKEGNLTLKEFDLLKSHVKRGYRIANASSELNIISEEILSHHEQWDGNGYPRGLKEEEIPIVVRVFSIINSYNLMILQHEKLDRIVHTKAMKKIKKESGLKFDERIVDIFIEIVELID